MVYCILFLWGGYALPQDVKRFEQVSEVFLSEHLGSQLRAYQKSFRADEHVLRVDTVVVNGHVQHLFTNQMAGLPGVIQLYQVQMEVGIRYLMVGELASPLGGALGIYLFNEQWDAVASHTLWAKYDAADFEVYQSPGGGVLLVVSSELHQSIYPHRGLSIFEVSQKGLPLVFQGYSHFTDTIDSSSDHCYTQSEIELCTKGAVLESVSIKRKHYCFKHRDIMSPQGPYVWNEAKRQYTLAFNSFSFDTLLKALEVRLPIVFDLDSDTIKEQHKPILDSLAAFLKRNEKVKLGVEAHLDTRWSDMYSSLLDMRRAGSICNYLKALGVRNDQLMAVGMGNDDPIVSAEEIAQMKTEEEKALAELKNRRIELLVLQR